MAKELDTSNPSKPAIDIDDRAKHTRTGDKLVGNQARVYYYKIY